MTLECEQMTPQAEMNHYHADGSTAYMGCNGYIKTDDPGGRIEDATPPNCSPRATPPRTSARLVEIHVDGKRIAQVQLTTEGWRSYPISAGAWRQGQHELSLWFLNDHSSPSGDRNLRLDKLVIYNDAEESVR